MQLLKDFCNNYLFELIIAVIFAYFLVEYVVSLLRNKAQLWIQDKTKLIILLIVTGVIFILLDRAGKFILKIFNIQ